MREDACLHVLIATAAVATYSMLPRFGTFFFNLASRKNRSGNKINDNGYPRMYFTLGAYGVWCKDRRVRRGSDLKFVFKVNCISLNRQHTHKLAAGYSQSILHSIQIVQIDIQCAAGARRVCPRIPNNVINLRCFESFRSDSILCELHIDLAHTQHVKIDCESSTVYAVRVHVIIIVAVVAVFN